MHPSVRPRRDVRRRDVSRRDLLRAGGGGIGMMALRSLLSADAMPTSRSVAGEPVRLVTLFKVGSAKPLPESFGEVMTTWHFPPPCQADDFGCSCTAYQMNPSLMSTYWGATPSRSPS